MFPLVAPAAAARPPQTAPSGLSATESPPGSTTLGFVVSEPAPIYPRVRVRIELVNGGGTYTSILESGSSYDAPTADAEVWGAVLTETGTFAFSLFTPTGLQGPRSLLVFTPSGGSALTPPSTALGPASHQATVTPGEASTLTRVVLEVYTGGSIIAEEQTFTSDGALTPVVVSHSGGLPLFSAYARHEVGADVSGWG